MASPVAPVQVANPAGGIAQPTIDGWDVQPLPKKIDPATLLPELLPRQTRPGNPCSGP